MKRWSSRRLRRQSRRREMASEDGKPCCHGAVVVGERSIRESSGRITIGKCWKSPLLSHIPTFPQKTDTLFILYFFQNVLCYIINISHIYKNERLVFNVLSYSTPSPKLILWYTIIISHILGKERLVFNVLYDEEISLSQSSFILFPAIFWDIHFTVNDDIMIIL